MTRAHIQTSFVSEDMRPSPNGSLVFHEEGISVGAQQVASDASDAIAQLETLLGPVLQRTIAGVKGSGLTAHWLASGTVPVSRDSDGGLLMLYVCFDEKDSSPYPDTVPVVPAFAGTVRCAGREFSGSETEEQVLALPGVEGFSGMLGLDDGRLHLGFDLRRRRDKFGKRAGSRSLVQIVAEWEPSRAIRRS